MDRYFSLICNEVIELGATPPAEQSRTDQLNHSQYYSTTTTTRLFDTHLFATVTFIVFFFFISMSNDSNYRRRWSDWLPPQVGLFRLNGHGSTMDVNRATNTGHNNSSNSNNYTSNTSNANANVNRKNSDNDNVKTNPPSSSDRLKFYCNFPGCNKSYLRSEHLNRHSLIRTPFLFFPPQFWLDMSNYRLLLF